MYFFLYMSRGALYWGDTKECFLYLLTRGGEIGAFLDDSVYNVPNIYSIYVLIGYNPVCLIIKNKRL